MVFLSSGLVHCDVFLSSVSCFRIRFDHLTSSASIVSSFVPQVYGVAAAAMASRLAGVFL